MPRIEWTALPAKVREHLLDRVRTRAIRAQDLAALLAWINTKPELPERDSVQGLRDIQTRGAGRDT